MDQPKEMSIRRLLSPEESSTIGTLRRTVLHQVLYFLMESGETREELEQVLREILAQDAGAPPPITAPMMPKETLAYGEILTAWHRDPDYLDTTGMPRVLPIRATNEEGISFEELCRRTYPNVELDEVLGYLTQYKAVVDKGGEVEMTETYLRLNKKDRESALYSVMVLAGVLNTMTLNRRDDAGLFQRGTWVANVHPEAIPRLKQLAHEQGMGIIKFFDDWMLNHVAEEGMPGIPVVIGMYMSAGALNSEAPR